MTSITTIFNKGGAPYPSTCKLCGCYDRPLMGITHIQPREGMLLFCQECVKAVVSEQLDFIGVETKESLDELTGMLHDQVKINAIQAENVKKLDEFTSKLKAGIDAAVTEFHAALGYSDPSGDSDSGSSNASSSILEAFKDA